MDEYTLESIMYEAVTERGGRVMHRPYDQPYDGLSDAEYILESIMFRRRWATRDRDKIAMFLAAVVHREREWQKARRAKMAKINEQRQQAANERELNRALREG